MDVMGASTDHLRSKLFWLETPDCWKDVRLFRVQSPGEEVKGMGDGTSNLGQTQKETLGINGEPLVY